MYVEGTGMETQTFSQGIGYEPLRLRNDAKQSFNIWVSGEAIGVGGSMIASFAVSTIEVMVDLFYSRPYELSFREFSTILCNSLTGAVHDGAKTGFGSILKEALQAETLGEVAIDFTSVFFMIISEMHISTIQGN